MKAQRSHSLSLPVYGLKTRSLLQGKKRRLFIFVSLIAAFLLFSAAGYSQNTKGDRPSTSRESRFRTPKKSSGKSRNQRVKRVRSKGPSVASSGRDYSPRARARGGERAGKPIKPVFSKSKPSKKDRPVTRDIANRRIRTRESQTPPPHIYPQRGRYVRKSIPDREVKRARVATRNRVAVRSQSGRIRNVYPQRGPFVNNPSVKPRDVQRPVSNRGTLARVRDLQTRRPSDPPKKRKIVPRSVSRAYIARKSINVYANFRRPKKKGERAVTRDIAGHRLRTRNYETPRQPVLEPTFQPYKGRKRIGDKAQIPPGKKYRTATKRGERAWTGDVAGRGIRRRDGSKRRVEGTPIVGRQPRSATQASEKRKRRMQLEGRPPRKATLGIDTHQGNIKRKGPLKTIGAAFRGKLKRFQAQPGFDDQGEEFAGTAKARKPAKGGGSVSGRLWNNRGAAVPAKRHEQRGGGFAGNIKFKKQPKGGGSASGRLWNNRGTPIPTRTPTSKDAARAAGFPGKNKRFQVQPGFADQGEEYTGGIKAKRIKKGGGSVSGKLWNNRQTPVEGKRHEQQGAGYAGNLKFKRPPKGGGSVSGRLWNNKENAIPTRTPTSREAAKVGGFPGKLKRFEGKPGFRDQGEEFTGHVKIKRPKKGGGSVSGKLWNNRETPVEGKRHDEQGAGFAGNIKYKRQPKGGGSVSGRLWNNKETPIAARTPPSSARQQGTFKGNIKRFSDRPVFEDQGEEFTGNLKLKKGRKSYIQNKLAHEESLKKKRPDKRVYAVEGLQIAKRRRSYVKNDNASALALMKLKPTKTTKDVAGLQRRVREPDNRHNPSSADDALNIREPGKAFARAVDYQGNIKMQKYRLFDKNRNLHPDARFVKTNKNNVADERDVFTNLKLWWARLFKKDETVPTHVKEKVRKPRYDKGEQGLWYD